MRRKVSLVNSNMIVCIPILMTNKPGSNVNAEETL